MSHGFGCRDDQSFRRLALHVARGFLRDGDAAVLRRRGGFCGASFQRDARGLLLDEVAQPRARALVLEVRRGFVSKRGDESCQACLFAGQDFSVLYLSVGKGNNLSPLLFALDFLRRAFVALFVAAVEEVEQRGLFEIEGGGVLWAGSVCLGELERREPLDGGRLCAEQSDMPQVPALGYGIVRRIGSVEGSADFFVVPFSYGVRDFGGDMLEGSQQRFAAPSQRLHPPPSGRVVSRVSEDEGGFVQSGVVAGGDSVERRAVDEDCTPAGVGVLSCAKNFDFGVLCHDALW